MWAKSTVQDKEITCEINDTSERSGEQKGLKSAHVAPEIWLPDSSKEVEPPEGDEEEFRIQHKIFDYVSPEINHPSDEDNKNGPSKLNKSIKYAHADPEIWVPIAPAKDESADSSENHMVYKDEIYEFDELCEFLNYTETKFYDEQFEEEQLPELPKHK